MVFNGAGTLRLDGDEAPARPIAGLAAGAAFDLAQAAGATASICGNTLLIAPTDANVLSFLSTAPLDGLAASAVDDGNGGTLVTLVAAATTALHEDLASPPPCVLPADTPDTMGMVMPTSTVSPVPYI